MNLLVTTQIVDSTDPRLGFFHQWLEEFAKHCEHVEVICLYEGTHALPQNVSVHSLGKEKRAASSVAYAYRFLRLSYKLRNQYSAVFVHMNPEYVVLGSVFWCLWNKRIGLWYLHKSVNLKLRLATLLADVIFTASEESFRLKSRKVKIIGHGIDVEKFNYGAAKPRIASGSESDVLRLVTVGRISRAKNIHTLVEVARLLGERGRSVSFDIIGNAVSESDNAYLKELSKQIQKLPAIVSVRLVGSKTNDEIAELLGEYDMFLHASTGTGSVDKAVLETLLCGVPAISMNEAFQSLLSPYGLFISEEGNSAEERMATAVEAFLVRPDQEEILHTLRDTVVEKYSLKKLIPRILSELQK